MLNLFGPKGRAALEELVRGRPLLAFDFDGTLCPLEDDADASRTAAANLPLLRALGRKVPIAIITGRSVRDIRGKLGFKPKYLVGNHGLEGLDVAAAARARAIARGWREQLKDHGELLAGDPGVFIEDKAYSLSLHYRTARRPAAARRLLFQKIARLTPSPRVVGGKLILNLTLARSAHKGTALTEIMRREKAGRTLFIGDDVTDEDAFALKRTGLLKVRVGRSTRSAAEYFVRDGDGVTKMLEWLHDHV